MLTEDLYKSIDKLVREFESQAVVLIKERIRQHAYASGDLEKSVRNYVERDASKLKHQILLDFSQYGKIMESKRRYSAGRDGARAHLDTIVDWIKAVGLSRFDFIPNYTDKVPSLDIAARRIAYGIFFGNAAKFAYRKTYGGYIIYRPYFGLWAKYREDIVTGYVTQTADQILDEVASNLAFGITGKQLKK